MKTILIIEDETQWTEEYIEGITLDMATILLACTLGAGEKLFFASTGIDLIFMDGCVDDPMKLDSLPLIKKIKESGYVGEMIAVSNNPIFCEIMMQAGCSSDLSKFDVNDYIQKIIKD